jgi:hypothetical protein
MMPFFLGLPFTQKSALDHRNGSNEQCIQKKNTKTYTWRPWRTEAALVGI